MTVALVDNFKQAKNKTDKSFTSTNYYYYNRIWDYKKIQADLSESGSVLQRHYIWESILFDLSTLEPLCVIQTGHSRQVKKINKISCT